MSEPRAESSVDDLIAELADVVAELQAEAPEHWDTQWLMVRADMAQALLVELERLRAENASLKRLLDDANERAAQIEDWQIKCALLEVDRDEQARLGGAVLDASMALYRVSNKCVTERYPEYRDWRRACRDWRRACRELAAFIGEGEAT